MLTFDHIAIAAEDLRRGTEWVEAELGVPLQPGGQHDRFGTHNMLLGLGDIYLEVITINPEAERHGPTWFGLDGFSGAPRPANWICRTDDLSAAIAAAPADVGPPHALTRGDLSWQITVPEDGGLPMQGACPTLIEWADGIVHPATRLKDQGVRLARWEVSHPEAEALARSLPLRDPRVRFVTGIPGFRAEFDTPAGRKVLA